MLTLERQAAITGVGMSAVGRRIADSGLSLTVDAALSAISDAGLKPADIDGIACWPGQRLGDSGSAPVSTLELKDSLGLKLNWFAGGPEGPGQLASIINAAMAVATGQARHVLCFRTLKEGSARSENKSATTVGGAAQYVSDKYQWLVPYGAISAANWTAMFAQRHMYEYGVTREQLAQVALTFRKHAMLNPHAIYRKQLTEEDYLCARMISAPLCLYDCDVPMDGATAVIVSHVDTAKDSPNGGLVIESASGALYGPDSWDQREDLTTMAASDAAQRLWSRTDFHPADVDFGQLYDGFSYYVLLWLEALGFCAKGESGKFVEGGNRISLGGQLPLNTGGGQLSAGRLHGFGLLHEACEQLWNRAGERQVSNATLGVVAVGGGPLASTILLRNF